MKDGLCNPFHLHRIPECVLLYLCKRLRNSFKPVGLYGNKVNCWLGDHIHPEGWDNWSDPANERTAYYAEYHNEGPGAASGKRVTWSHQLIKKQAQKYTPDHIFGDWNPLSER